MTTSVDIQPPPTDADVPTLRATLQEFTEACGYRHFTYVAGRLVGGRRITNFDARKRPLHMTNIPDDWKSEYFGKKYCDHDPVWLFALGNLLPERWSTIVRRTALTAKQAQIMNVSRDAGLRGVAGLLLGLAAAA